MVVVVEETDDKTKRKTFEALAKMREEFRKGLVISKELDKVWRKIKNDAMAICPKDTGALASTIRIRKIPIGTAAGAFARMKQFMIFDRSIIAGDITKTNPKSGKPVDYASWVHDGHKMKDGRMWNGIPFLTLAIGKNDAELNDAIKRALRKLGKKYERD